MSERVKNITSAFSFVKIVTLNWTCERKGKQADEETAQSKQRVQSKVKSRLFQLI